MSNKRLKFSYPDEEGSDGERHINLIKIILPTPNFTKILPAVYEIFC